MPADRFLAVGFFGGCLPLAAATASAFCCKGVVTRRWPGLTFVTFVGFFAAALLRSLSERSSSMLLTGDTMVPFGSGVRRLGCVLFPYVVPAAGVW